MKIIGITGQTGAGKSTACRLLEKRGYCHIDADEVAHRVVETDADVLKALSARFGKDIIKKDGTLSRKKLARRAFKSKQSAEALDEICYPAVVKEIRRIIRNKTNENYNGIIIDAIGLFESGADKLCDFTVSVTAPEKIRLERIIARDGISAEAAKNRISAQKDESFFADKASYTLANTDLSGLEEKLEEILNNEQT